MRTYGALGAWVNPGTTVCTIVILHQSRICDRSIRRSGSHNSNTSLRFLHDNSKNEAMVNFGRSSNLLDSSLDIVDFILGIVGSPAIVLARFEHEDFVVTEHVFEVDPLVDAWEAECSISSVENVTVAAGTASVIVVDGRGNVSSHYLATCSRRQVVGWQSRSKCGQAKGGKNGVSHFERGRGKELGIGKRMWLEL